jgi:acyl-CoA thioesterase II
MTAVMESNQQSMSPTDRAGSGSSNTASQGALDDLVTLLDLEAIEVNIFRGRSPDENRQRVFGGQVAGQALVAAARTIDERGRLVHSLHAYFLRPGDPTVPILYEVDRIRDGRSFSTRRVVAIQHGRAIFNLQASFHDDEPGPDHQLEMPAGMGDPLDLPDFHTRMAPYAEQIGDWYHRPRPIDLRYVDGDPTSRRGQSTTKQHVWLRADGVLPDDPVLHACVVTYASDMTLLDTTLLPFGLDWETAGMQMASVDHAMWFHRPFRADDWLLYAQSAVSTSSARGMAQGSIFTSDGRLAVSVVQEGLTRLTS